MRPSVSARCAEELQAAQAVRSRAPRETSSNPASRTSSGRRPAACSRVLSNPSSSRSARNAAAMTGSPGRPQSAMCRRPPGRRTRRASARAARLPGPSRWCSSNDITTASALASSSGSRPARPSRQFTRSAPGLRCAAARMARSPSTAMTGPSVFACPSAMANVPVPQPTSTTLPRSGSSRSTCARSSSRKWRSRMVSATTGSYRRVNAARPAAGT